MVDDLKGVCRVCSLAVPDVPCVLPRCYTVKSSQPAGSQLSVLTRFLERPVVASAGWYKDRSNSIRSAGGGFLARERCRYGEK